MKKFKPLSANVVIALVILLGLLLFSYALLEIHSTEREMVHLLRDDSIAIITALREGSRNAAISFDRLQELEAGRLLSLARLVEELDYNEVLTPLSLQQIAEQNRVFRINLFDSTGRRVMSNMGGRRRTSAPADLMELIEQEQNDELLIGFRSGRFGTGQRFAVAVRRRRGGAVVINVDADEMLEFRRSIGLGRLIRDVGSNPGILYVALQDTAAVLAASAGVDSLVSLSADPFLMRAMRGGDPLTRLTSYKGNEVYEIVQTLELENGINGLLRIGISAQHLSEAKRAARTRIAVITGLLFVIGAILANWVVGRQNYRALQGAYARIETYTGRLLSNMSDAVVAVDRHGKITLLNRAAGDLLGIERDAALGRPYRDVTHGVGPLLQRALSEAEGAEFPELEVRIGGVTRFLVAGTAVLRDEQDRVDTAFIVARDVTAQKKLEQNLRRRDRITAMGHLASGVAHEIRNPLNAISMIAQRLRAEFIPSKDKSEFTHLTTTLVNETGRINDIIGQFLQFARPVPLQKRPVDLAALVSEVATLLEPQAREKGVTLESHCSPVPELSADPDKLKSALLNLGQNSLEACDSGGRIDLICGQAQKSIQIEIRDNGRGIPEEIRERIFNLYFTTREGGTGVGLSIVQQIVSQHDGTIEVDSGRDRGTTFTLNFPLPE